MGQKRVPKADLTKCGVNGKGEVGLLIKSPQLAPQAVSLVRGYHWLKGYQRPGPLAKGSPYLLTAALGAALGHSVGFALPATCCPAGCGDRQGLGRDLPSLLP